MANVGVTNVFCMIQVEKKRCKNVPISSLDLGCSVGHHFILFVINIFCSNSPSPQLIHILFKVVSCDFIFLEFNCCSLFDREELEFVLHLAVPVCAVTAMLGYLAVEIVEKQRSTVISLK